MEFPESAAASTERGIIRNMLKALLRRFSFGFYEFKRPSPPGVCLLFIGRARLCPARPMAFVSEKYAGVVATSYFEREDCVG